jgi:hypothetical protein
MSELPIDALAKALAALRADPSCEPSIRSTVFLLTERPDIQLSPGARLKLRRGSLHDLMAIAATILPGCSHCSSLCPATIFNSREEHAKCAQFVDAALLNGTLKRIARPVWVMPDSMQLGADAYFLCVTCGSIWTLVEPDKQCHGLWSRIA